MFQPKFKKEAKLLQKGVRKFLRYKIDILSVEKVEQIKRLSRELGEAAEQGKEKKCDLLSKKLTHTCEQALPQYRYSGIRENLEVLFVAIVIALGVRSYFLQPFKIPTGSMQPTLNGIIAVPHDERRPGFLKRALHYVTLGRNYVEVRAQKEDKVVKMSELTRARFWTFTRIHYQSGDTQDIYAPLTHTLTDLGLGQALGARKSSPLIYEGRESRVKGEVLVELGKGRVVRLTKPDVQAGQLLAQGYVDTGDQVLVDKLSYHFRKPKRGEVFVFTTKRIRGIEHSPSFNPAFGSQHYIKRLAGVPGDSVEIVEPELFINGKLAQERGFKKVMGAKNGYKGYKEEGEITKILLKEKEYFALGDNSGNSLDSRMWGVVPQNNLVGPALMVYWPFSAHWGLIW